MEIELQAECFQCHNTESTTVKQKEFVQYAAPDGPKLQQAFPDHKPWEREVILAHHPRNTSNPLAAFLCSRCWAMIPEE